MIGLVIFVVFIFFGMVLMFISMVNGDEKSHSNRSRSSRPSSRRQSNYSRCRSGFFDSDSDRTRSSRPSGNPFDNHWESSFDWQDKNNDGYDDRDDGFWNEREF